MVFKDHKNSKYKKILDETKEEERLGLHSFHRYYGKLIPAIPRTFIREFTKEGQWVLDPFSGSGTTALETKFLNRNFVGIEINPLSVLMIKVKTNDYNIDVLQLIFNDLLILFEKDNKPVKEESKPFCVNRDHWFKDFVQNDLLKLQRNIDKAVSKNTNEKDKQKYIDFFTLCISAIVKQVSNADTMHVFPGISKRIRRLEAEGKIHINVFETFKRAVNKRIKWAGEIKTNKNKIDIIYGDSTELNLKKYYDKIDLVVTNPPYISSVRYAETLKLELYWMQYLKSQKDYADLSTSMIGNDHIPIDKCKDINNTGYKQIDEYIKKMFEIDKKQAEVLSEYFISMEKVISNISKCVKKNGKVVIKISDSKIRKTTIPTGKLLTEIGKRYKFELLDVFNDKINDNSRSLLLSRNTYSDIILEDNIVIWQKR